jgi:acyl-CoA thioester hydrolase
MACGLLGARRGTSFLPRPQAQWLTALALVGKTPSPPAPTGIHFRPSLPGTVRCAIMSGFFGVDFQRMALDPGELPEGRLGVRVYYEDTDAGGVVYHARYLHFMERARTEWLRGLGFEQDRVRAEHGVLFAVRRMDIAFLHPARFNDLLRVDTVITDHGRASLDFAQTVLREDDAQPCCRATVNIACLDAERLRPARIPEDIMTAILPEAHARGR